MRPTRVRRTKIRPSSNPFSKSTTSMKKRGANSQSQTFVLDAHASSRKGANTMPKSLVKVFYDGDPEHTHRLKGRYVRFTRLTQHDSFFDSVKKDPNATSWVPTWVKFDLKNPVCMVIGVMICEDVEVVWEEEAPKEVEAIGNIPIISWQCRNALSAT